MADKRDEFLNRIGHERLSARQIDELIGLARGIAADGNVNQAEAVALIEAAEAKPVKRGPYKKRAD